MTMLSHMIGKIRTDAEGLLSAPRLGSEGRAVLDALDAWIAAPAVRSDDGYAAVRTALINLILKHEDMTAAVHRLDKQAVKINKLLTSSL